MEGRNILELLAEIEGENRLLRSLSNLQDRTIRELRTVQKRMQSDIEELQAHQGALALLLEYHLKVDHK